MRVLVLHGPNVNLLPDAERRFTNEVKTHGQAMGLAVDVFQANGEGALLDELHRRRGTCQAVVINAGVLAPHAVALAEALKLLELRAVEVQLTAREGSALAKVVERQCIGERAYIDALDQLAGVSTPAAPARRGKTIGKRSVEVTDESPALTKKKPLGRTEGSHAAHVPGAAQGPTRLAVRDQISRRLAGKLSPDALAAWARTQWQAVTGGAEVEPGARAVLEDVLLTLAASAKASDHVVLAAMAKLDQ